MEQWAAAIDIGTYTARLLVAKVEFPTLGLCEMERARFYIKLGEMSCCGGLSISESAYARTVDAVLSFQKVIKKYPISRVTAVGTGVLRLASNGSSFLSRLKEETGLEVELISGEREALLSGLGVEAALNLQGRDSVIFDLGGGSIEFFTRKKETIQLRSVPIGAMTLTKRFLIEDPPQADELASLSRHLDISLSDALKWEYRGWENPVIAGTGGTAVTLACMKKGLDVDSISTSSINGTILTISDVDALVAKLGSMSIKERAALDCLDNSRAFVIVAGCLTVSRLLHILKAEEMTVSMSDLLEGILMESYGGENDE